MAQIRQYLLIGLAGSLLAAAPAEARKFYDDDPIWREPRPVSVEKLKSRKINEYFDFFQQTFFEPIKDLRKSGKIPPAEGVNTLGEVPDSGWFTNRIGSRPLMLRDLVRGPGESNRPSPDGPWTVLSGKEEGITPGLLIEDSNKKKFFLKFDPRGNPEMATAPDVIGSKFFYGLGYNVPENHIVYFQRRQLVVNEKSVFTGLRGKKRPLTEQDIRNVLDKVPRDKEQRYRALASFMIPGEPIGPFRYHGARRDDPNDVVPHENRRDLRGLYVFSAWLNHTDTKSINSLDSVVEENGVRMVKHYLLDFGAILGSDSFEGKSPRAGNVYLFDFKPAAGQFLSFGFYVPAWMRVDYPHIPAAGHFESASFNPEKWRNNYPNPAFDLRLPDDNYWAAKKVMAFTGDRIRAIVETGEFTDPRAVEWITKVLIERRDKIGRAFFDGVLPLDGFHIRGNRLAFDDLAVKYGFEQPRRFSVAWSRFDNDSERKTPIAAAAGFELPKEFYDGPGGYFAADIRGGDPQKTVTVYLRKRGNQAAVVGIDRTW